MRKDGTVSSARFEVNDADRQLFIAVMRNDVVAAEAALRPPQSANVGAEDNEKNQPLYFAVCYGFVDMAELLLRCVAACYCCCCCLWFWHCVCVCVRVCVCVCVCVRACV